MMKEEIVTMSLTPAANRRDVLIIMTRTPVNMLPRTANGKMEGADINNF